MQYARFKDFDRSLNALWRKGGKFQKAAERIHSALSLAQSGLDAGAGLKPTGHGEARIPQRPQMTRPGPSYRAWLGAQG
jgi:hypothetical protein